MFYATLLELLHTLLLVLELVQNIMCRLGYHIQCAI
uniref:Uncharacterized protein n=1 Tax=Rhizophora mucronata TaxID=61149 RepID=A0A2P2ND67_RHIMU